MYYLLKVVTRLRRSRIVPVHPSASDDSTASSATPSASSATTGEGDRLVRHRRPRHGLASLLLGLPLVFTIIVVNFIGGFIPYIGAFLGGGLP